MTTLTRLSKSRFTSGLQCHKKLWWEVHDKDAPELQPDKVLQDLFDQGRQVGEAARARYPGGVLIDLPHDAGPTGRITLGTSPGSDRKKPLPTWSVGLRPSALYRRPRSST